VTFLQDFITNLRIVYEKNIIKPLFIELRPSKFIKSEIGLFAVRSLQKGTVIAHANKMDEHFVSWKAYNKLDKKTKVKVQQFCIANTRWFFCTR
jgi:hypothetical protein